MKVKNNPKRNRVIWGPETCFPFAIGFCPNEAAWLKCMKEFEVTSPPMFPTADGNCTFFRKTDKHYAFCLICINPGDRKLSKIQIHGLIVHEVNHAICYMFKSIGEKRPSVELTAYMHQAFFQSMARAFDAFYSKSRKR